MINHAELLQQATERAKTSLLSGRPQQPRSLFYVGNTVHQFNYPFLGIAEDDSRALFMKGICSVLSPDYIISIAQLSFASAGPVDSAEPPASAIQDGLLILLQTPDMKSQARLIKTIPGKAGTAPYFTEMGDLDLEGLSARTANPYAIPDEGLPEEILVRAREMLGHGAMAALRDRLQRIPGGDLSDLH